MTDQLTTTSGTEGGAPATPTTPATSAATKKASKVNNPYVWGTGRRKTAVARVRIKPGTGQFVVNKREMDKYFMLDKDREAVRTPLEVTDTGKAFDVFVNVGGGGVSGQAGAIMLGLARALLKTNPDHLPKLRERNLLHRDPRKVERKKYGQSGARKRFQFSKR